MLPHQTKPTSRSRRLSVHLGREQAASQRLSDVAYVSVLQGLFDRRIPIGAFMTQSALVRLLGIPVQPLRDALRVLETEGVLTIHPRSGIEFLRADAELARSTYQFRTILEQVAVRRFAAHGEAAIVEQLRREHLDLAGRIEKDDLSGHRRTLQDLDIQLHAALTSALRNPLIETTVRRLDNYVNIVQLDRRITGPMALQTIREHLAILDACRDRHMDRAEEAVIAHLEAALARVLEMI